MRYLKITVIVSILAFSTIVFSKLLEKDEKTLEAWTNIEVFNDENIKEHATLTHIPSGEFETFQGDSNLSEDRFNALFKVLNEALFIESKKSETNAYYELQYSENDKVVFYSNGTLEWKHTKEVYYLKASSEKQSDYKIKRMLYHVLQDKIPEKYVDEVLE